MKLSVSNLHSKSRREATFTWNEKKLKWKAGPPPLANGKHKKKLIINYNKVPLRSDKRDVQKLRRFNFSPSVPNLKKKTVHFSRNYGETRKPEGPVAILGSDRAVGINDTKLFPQVQASAKTTCCDNKSFESSVLE